MKKILFFLDCTRAYALPMSIMAWAIAFAFGISQKGHILYGIIALLGIVSAHLGANLFDDIIDYKKFLKTQKEEKKINLKKGKCRCFLEEKLSVFSAVKLCIILFGTAFAVGFYFINIYKLPILIIMSISGFLCLLYPKSGYIGLSEIIIGTIFSPLLFSGVFYVMTGTLSNRLLWLSFSFVFVTISLLYTDFYLDYNTDKAAGKKTIPILVGSKQNAYYVYIAMIFLIYAILFVGIHGHLLSAKYFIIFLSVIPALKTIKTLQDYTDKEIKDEKDFMNAMNNVQKFVSIFTILSIICFF